MSRLKKLLLVSLVLGIGVGLAWPFRKTGSEATSSQSVDTHQPIATLQINPESPPAIGRGNEAPTRHVVAKMASTGESSRAVSAKASFDLANHPSVTRQAGETSASPVTPTNSTAGQQVLSSTDGDNDTPTEVLHIVRDTDTLEKLAKRYLGDGGRALELFDLNRDRLENPHLLPIGAELRIPVDPARIVD